MRPGVLRSILRVVVPYMIFAGLWILLSDRLLEAVLADPAARVQWSIYKGWMFVVVTGLLLASTLRVELEARVRTTEALQMSEERMRGSQELLQSITEGTSDAIFVKDLAGRYVLFSSGACKTVGRERADVLGKDDFALFSSEDASMLVANDRRIRETGQTETFEDAIIIEGRLHTFLSTKGPVRDRHGRITGVFGITRDITERKREEEELARLNRALRMISESNQALFRARDEVGLLEAICRIAVEHGGYRLAWVGLAEEDEARSVRPVAQAGFDDGYLQSVGITWSDTARGQGPTGTAIRTGQPVIAQNILTAPAFAPWREAAIERGYSSSAALPLKVHGKIIGAFMLYSEEPEAFSEAEVKFLEGLADDVAYGLTTLKDRAKRRRAEEEVMLANQKLANIIEFLPDATFVIDQEGKVVEWNRACEAMTGIPKEAILGQGDYAHALAFRGERAPILVDMLDRPLLEAEQRYPGVKRVGDTLSAEFFHPRLRGGVGAHLWGAAAPLFDHEGRRWGAIEVVRDVTVQKRIEEALRESESMVRSILRAAPVGVLILQDRVVRSANRYWCEVFGYEEEEIVGRSTLMVYESESEWRRVGEVLYGSLAERGEAFAETRMLCRDGSIRYVSLSVALLRPDDPSAGVVEIVHDISDRKESEQALQESERKYRELVELANSIILRWSRDGRITFLNEYGQSFFGYSTEEILGRHVMGTIVPMTDNNGKDMGGLIEGICADPSAFERNVNENMRRNGERVWIAWTNRFVLDSRGQAIEILSVGADITEQKRAEEAIRELNVRLEKMVEERTKELALARDRAEEADRTKSAFLAIMSHELRTPLNSIIGFTGIILMELAGPLNGEQRKQLEMVRNSARHLLALINDVLDISKIEAGQLTVSQEAFDPLASIEKVTGIVRPLAEKKGLDFTVETSGKMDPLVSDPRRVEQILLNLLNNAIKFTEQGSVTLHASIEAGALCISVTDTGIGIREEDLGKLFQPFRQIDTGLSRQHEGTGLGLAICRKLAGLLGGEITVRSEWGKGSVFTFTLPVDRQGET